MLTVVTEGQEYHPFCTPDHVKLPGTTMTPYDMVVKEEMLEIIQWGAADSPRSRQTVLGCSEVGGDCDRRIAYRIAGTKAVNFPDPLKSSMGTAYHTWLDQRMNEWMAANRSSRYLTETEVWAADFIKGHVDLYDRKNKLVLDWKTTSSAMIKEWTKSGIPNHYLVQIMLYGKGMIRAGHEVQRVGLIGIDRSGALRNVIVLTVPYDEEVAVTALRRTWNIGKQITSIPDFAQISSSPSRLCTYCPWYRGGKGMADDRGCPGIEKPESTDPLGDLFN